MRSQPKGKILKRFVKIVSFAVIILVLVTMSGETKTRATSKDIGTSEISDGIYDFNQIDTTGGTVKLQKGDLGQWSGTESVVPPPVIGSFAPNHPSATWGPDNSLYYVSYNNLTTYFLRYKTAYRTWETLSSPPVAGGVGVNILYDGSRYIYYMPGGNSSSFFKYDVAASTWIQLTSLPVTVGTGATMTYVTSGQGKIFAFRGNNSNILYSYSVANEGTAINPWGQETAFPANYIDCGFSMTWDRGDFLYAISNRYGELKKYSISNKTWSANLRQHPRGWYSESYDKLFWIGNDTIIDVSFRMYAGTGNPPDVSYTYSYNSTSNLWSNLPSPPNGQLLDIPMPAAYDGSDTIYAMFGNQEMTNFYKYSISTQKWDGETTPLSLYYSVPNTFWHYRPIFDGDHSAYYIASYGESDTTQRFIKLNLLTGEKVTVNPPNTSAFGRIGTAGVQKDGYMYFLQFYDAGSNSFVRYNIALDSWEQLSSLPANTTWGSDIVDGGDGYLYATTGGNANFYRFNLSAGTWASVGKNLPFSIGRGGGLTVVGTSIYASSGYTSNAFAKLDISALPSASWSILPNIPVGYISFGGTIQSDGNRYIYVIPSTRLEDGAAKILLRYDTESTDYKTSWKRMADLPSGVNTFAYSFYVPATNSNDTIKDRLFVAPSSSLTYLWSWTPTNSSYVQAGTWYSKPFDLGQVNSWNNFIKTSTGNTTFYSRSSDNGQIWANWTEVGTAIASQGKRYLQLKAELSGDGTSTPEISAITLSYQQENQAPEPPSRFIAKAKQTDPDSQTLTSGNNAASQHPYFEWSDDFDWPQTNGSGIKGYWIYFGTQSDANPTTAGTFQTTKNYTANIPLTNDTSYFFRMVVEDNLGNQSNPTEFFTYVYRHISPPTSYTVDNEVENNGANNSDFNTPNMNYNLDSPDGTGARLAKQKNGSLETGSWTTGTFTEPPDTFGVFDGGAATVVNGNLYVLKGSNTNIFYKYEIEKGSWQALTSAPNGIKAGSTLVWDQGNYLYAMRGNQTANFFRYDISNNRWLEITTLPTFANAGSDMVYIGSNQFLVMLSGIGDFYQYRVTNNDTGTGIWSNKAPLPATVGTDPRGSGMWFDGNDTVYAHLGTMFCKYSVRGDTWTTLSNPPASFWYMEKNIVGDGHGNLYTFGSDGLYNGYATGLKYNIASNSWSQIPSYVIAGVRYRAGALTSDNDRYVYIFPALSDKSKQVIQYDTLLNKFSPPGYEAKSLNQIRWRYDYATGRPWNYVNGNSNFTYDGTDYIYMVGGSEYNTFAKYSVSKGTTEYLPPPPIYTSTRNAVYLKGYVYLGTTAGSSPNDKQFYRFNTFTKSWERLTDFNDSTPGAMVTDGNDIYYTNIISGIQKIYRYTPDSQGGSWTNLNDAIPNSGGSTVTFSITFDDHYIYIMRNGVNNFYRFDLNGTGATKWEKLTNLQGVTLNYGNSIVTHNGQLFATIGGNNSAMYIYNISSRGWAIAGQTPQAFDGGGNLIKVGDKAFGFPGYHCPEFYQFNFPSTNTGYYGIGLHTSSPIQTTGLFDYSGISADVTIPANTNIEFYTRTSSDGQTYSNWSLANAVKSSATKIFANVTSTPSRYIQIKALLYSYDNVSTPTLNSYSLGYYADTNPPANPNSIKFYTDKDHIDADHDLSNPNNDPNKPDIDQSNSWFNHPKVYIKWSGAFDANNGSGIKGYYVFFDEDPTQTAVPQTVGQFQTGDSYEANLTASGRYRIRIQTVDNTNNVSSSIYSPYEYRFDNVAPTNPAMISVTPSGYTATNNFTFNWEANPGTDSNGSGIKEYCYHTGATSGAYATEQCQPVDGPKKITDAQAAYRQGTNVFYLRTRDYAGNFSDSYLTVSYYYSTEPPTLVTNLTATPTTSNQNLFAFRWELPNKFAGAAEKLTYCYSVNELPQDNKVTCTEKMYIAPFAAATRFGSNTLYIYAKDETNRYDDDNVASVNFTANTISPGIPTNLVATDTSDMASNRWSVTLTWSKPTSEGNGIANYQVERSVDKNNYTSLGSVPMKAFVDMDVTSGQTYYYRVRAADNVNNASGYSSIASQSPKGKFITAPSILTVPAVTTGFDHAEISWITSRSCDTNVVYFGTDPGNMNNSRPLPIEANAPTTHYLDITGLEPNTIYYVKTQSYDSERSYADLTTTFSDIITFKTQDVAKIEEVRVSDITSISALVSWRTTTPTKGKIVYSYQYENTGDYDTPSNDESTYSVDHLMKIDNLVPGAKYHFRVSTEPEYGGKITSDDYNFSTIPDPAISNILFQPVADAATITVQMSWKTNVPTDSVVSYRATGIKQQEATDSSLITEHSMTLSDLAASVKYEFTIRGRDEHGNSVVANNVSWESGADTRPPTILDFTISTSTNGPAGSSKAQIIASWHTDEPSTSQVRYNIEGSNLQEKDIPKTPLDTELTTSHIVVIPDLQLAKIYKLRPESKDVSGNIGYGEETIAITPDQDSSVLNLLIKLLEKLIGKLGA